MIFLLIAAGAYLLPELLSVLGLGTEAAWSTVAYGTEAALLWVFVGMNCRDAVSRAAAAWGAVEAAMRPICRLSFSMHERPNIGGANLCDAAFGMDTLAISYTLALIACSVALATCKTLHSVDGGRRG